MHIEPFDPVAADEASARAYADFVRTYSAQEWPNGLLPPVEHVLNRLRNMSPTHRVRIWKAVDGGELAGTAEVSWWESEDNRDRAWIHPLVVPGADVDAVLDGLFAAADACLRPLGRSLLMVEVPRGDAVAAWVEARGGRPGSAEEHNVVRLRSLDRSDVAALAAAAPEGYELLTFGGAIPDDLLEAYTRLMETMNTAPRDDLTMEDWVYTPQRLRDYEDGLRARGHTMWHAVAREVATGELAAFNQLVVRPEWPEAIENEDTAVTVPHRGHGLGLWVKAANLLKAIDDCPEAQVVTTWNAASNEHMLRVNRRLGFVCEHVWDTWELTLEPQPA